MSFGAENEHRGCIDTRTIGPERPQGRHPMIASNSARAGQTKKRTRIQAENEQKIQSALLNQAMKISAVDRTLAQRLNLDMSKVSDWEKL